MLISSRHICIRSIFGSFSLTTIYSIQTLMAPRCLGFLCKQAGSGGGVGGGFLDFLSKRQVFKPILRKAFVIAYSTRVRNALKLSTRLEGQISL